MNWMKVFAGICVLAVGFLIYLAVQQAMLDPFGIVVKKRYKAPYYVREIVVNDVHIPSQYHPEAFTLTLENGKTIYLRESAWDQVEVGQWWGER